MSPATKHDGRARRSSSSANKSAFYTCQSSSPSAFLILSVLLVSVSIQGIEAIVKQQARSDESVPVQQQQQQQQQQPQSSQQQSNAQSSGNNGPISYNPSTSSGGSPNSANHQQSSGASARSQGGSSVASPSSSASSAQSAGSDPMMVAGSFASSSQPKQSGPYQSYGADQMMAAASNVDQSYQAAAHTVNMALANSGIFSSPASGVQSSQQAGQQQQQSQAQQSSGPSASALNPLHYFYYPAAKESISSASGPGSQMKQLDMMSSASSNQYVGGAGSYADPASGQTAPSPFGVSGIPEMAASNQDPSYLPPQIDQQQSQPGQQSPMSLSQQQQSQSQSQSQSQPQQQQPQQYQSVNQYTQPQDGYGQHPSSSGSSISFNGPSSISGAQIGGPQDNFMNSHLNGHQQQQQQNQYGPNQGSSMFAGDLSTSNFGNMPSNGLGSSYALPPSQQSPLQQAYDSYMGGAGQASSTFSSAATQLSPAAVAPPAPQQQQQQHVQAQGPSSLLSTASSLFGGSSQQQAQQQSGLGGNYFASQHYLNSFLRPQQYTQLTGQQISDLQEHPLLGQAGLGSSASMPVSASVSSNAAGGSTAAASSSSKRFGLSSLVMPVLALAGLSLLIPTMSNIGTAAVGRKKRSIIEEKASMSSRQQQLVSEPAQGVAHQLAKESLIGEYLDRIQRYYSIYQNAVESDDCMNRLICEFGDAVKDVTAHGAVINVVESLAPSWMKAGGNKMQIFKEAASTHGSVKDKCKKYICQRGTPSSNSARQHRVD